MCKETNQNEELLHSMAPPTRRHPANTPEQVDEKVAGNISSRNLGSIASSSIPAGSLLGNPMPMYGAVSTSGLPTTQSRDKWVAVEDFCHPCLHFFAVYDGHGSPYVSSLCRDRMHSIIGEELLRTLRLPPPGFPVRGGQGRGHIGSSSSSAQGINQVDGNEDSWKNKLQLALKNSFEKMDQEALRLCSLVGVSDAGTSEQTAINYTGSSANVAILWPRHILVANCGDSRAVLCRAGRAIPLSQDHKPYRQDEQERIYAAGGQLIHDNGLRVNGMLAMTRAIGVRPLKNGRLIISEPEITITERHKDDEFLIIASDGIWDHISNTVACNTVRDCLRKETLATSPGPNETSGKDPYNLAASVLCRLAFGRGSRETIHAVIVDLKRGTRSNGKGNVSSSLIELLSS